MESIQLAQMLADLSDLNAAQEAKAALGLVDANKSLPPTPDLSKTPEHPQQQRNHHRASSASGIISWTTSPAKFDKFGRRILSPPTTRSTSPHNNGTPGTSTPRKEAQTDDDVARASSLMQLYEIRAKLKQQDTTSLNRARERINAIQARQHSHTPIDRSETQSRFSYPKTP